MPLAPDRLLVGSLQFADATAPKRFNYDAAACCSDFFVANRSGSDLDALIPVIGLQTRQTIEQSMASAFDAFKAERRIARQTREELAADVEMSFGSETAQARSGQAILQYQVTFQGISNEDVAKRISAVLESIVRELRPIFPLDRLDGFTFASDYEAALRDFNHGFQRSRPLTPTKEEYGVGVAMAPIVLRGDTVKSHIIAHMWIATGLIADDETQQLAIHTIIQQLAHVACTQILDEALPGFLANKLEDAHEAFLYGGIGSAWTGYFAARASAVFNPDFGAAYQELAIAALRRALEAIPTARLAYRYHGNLDVLLETVFPTISAVLTHMGNLLGHYDGLRQSAFDDEQLHTALESAELRAWADLFREDLARVWDRSGKWTSSSEFMSLNRHTERLFWRFGMIPWKTPEGLTRIEIPIHSDAPQLSRPA
jgi:hypothetical protein